jgi:DNA-binding GntR family transcriptional regulator
MTRQYAALRLLEHGPLCFRDFLAITGWSEMTARCALNRLRAVGAVDIVNHAYTLP